MDLVCSGQTNMENLMMNKVNSIAVAVNGDWEIHYEDRVMMMMTLREVQPSVDRGLASQECKGHNTSKKNLSELVRLALLARLVLTHG